MRRHLFLAAVVLGGLLGTAPPAAAATALPAPVSTNPVDRTPHILDGTVRAIAVSGGTVVVGGDFTTVTDPAGRGRHQRRYLFEYDLATGRISDAAPALNGPVYALAAGPAGTVYVGGAFTRVNGVAQRGLARLRIADGDRVPEFTAAINYGDVRSLVVAGSWLYAGGTFTGIGTARRVALARLATSTGTPDPDFDLRLTAPTLARVKVEDLAVNPAGTRLVAVGAIEAAAGAPRAQLVMVDIAAVPARLASWYTDAYTGACREGFDTYLRGVDFAPDGQYFAVVTTGRLSGPDMMCDTVARFDTAGSGLHRPVWVNRTGGDSLYAVSVAGSAVYVGGHQRWLDNPYGHESRGAGAVSRPGIAAVDPVTGRALAWNPTRSRGVGVRALVACPAGLLVGSDTDRLGHEYHGRIGMFPTA
jgi:Domain of unknown function (DUF5122) beta-propeller